MDETIQSSPLPTEQRCEGVATRSQAKDMRKHVSLFENDIALAGKLAREMCQDFKRTESRGNATKGVWWMPWHQRPKKDVVDCDKRWGAVCRRNSHRFPNGATHLKSLQVPVS